MKSENYKKIAEIIKKWLIKSEQVQIWKEDIVLGISNDLVNYFEEEVTKKYKSLEFEDDSDEAINWLEKNYFNKTQFLKDCGVQ